MSADRITLDCGCVVQLRESWEYGCAGDCHPGSYVTDSGALESTCALHTPASVEDIPVCPFDCDSCHDPEECPCENCERCRE